MYSVITYEFRRKIAEKEKNEFPQTDAENT